MNRTTEPVSRGRAYEAIVQAWEGSWLGGLARSIWAPQAARSGGSPGRSGEGLALAGLVALSLVDTWAFQIQPSALVAWLALVLTLVVVVKTEAGLWAVLAVIPFVPDLVAAILVVGCVLATLVRRLAAVGWKPRLLRVRLPRPVLLLGLLLMVATVTSVSPAASLRYLAVWGLGIALYWATGEVTRDTASLIRGAVAFGLSAALGGLHGLYQAAIHIPVERAWIDAALVPVAATRVFSFWDNPNVFALHLLLTGPVLAATVWTTRGRWPRLLVTLAVVVAGLALVLTLSRTGWVGLGVAFLVIGLARDWRILLVGVAAAGIAVVSAPQLVLARVATLTRFDDPAAVHRIGIWQASWRMVHDFWYSGLGLSWRAFAAVYPQYAIGGKAAFHSHSHYLETVVELGVVGFAALHWLLLRPLVWLAGLSRELRQTAAGAVLVGAAAAILGSLAFGIGEPIFYLPRPILLAWALLGLAEAARRCVLEVRSEEDHA